MIFLKNLNRAVVQTPHKILSKVAAPVLESEFGTAELGELIDVMFEIMRDKSGAGLAAPQVGISKRIFVYGFEHNPRYPEQTPLGFKHLINPEIVHSGNEEIEYEEGCLSVPGYRGIVVRPATVTVRAFNKLGEKVELVAKNFEARVIQHEMDHLNGILFTARAVKIRPV